MSLQVLPLKVLVSRLVIKNRMDYSSYLNGVAKEELDRLDKLAGDFKIETVEFIHQGRKVAAEDLEQFKECVKQMVPKKVTDFFFGRREISIVERISSRGRTWVIYDMDGREKNMMCREGFSIKGSGACMRLLTGPMLRAVPGVEIAPFT